jgi:hypothetical protein
MEPLKLSARFAAYAWYTEVRRQATPDEAVRFAEDHWRSFLAAADDGWGQLLMRLAGPRRAPTKGGRRRHARRAAMAGAN